MKCPYCKALNNDKVIDSRLTEGGTAIRRRRQCEACGRRFTTKERPDEEARLVVVKRDGARVPFERAKIVLGLRRTCYKRPVSDERIQAVADQIEELLTQAGEREVSSRQIGEMVSAALREIDQIAYVRFASVYRDFQDVGEFIEEAQDVIQRKRSEVDGQRQLFDSTDP